MEANVVQQGEWLRCGCDREILRDKMLLREEASNRQRSIQRLDDLGRQTCDLAPSCCTKLVGHHTVDASTKRFLLVVEEYTGIIVESNDTTVRPCHLLLGAHDDGVSDVSSSHLLCAGLTGCVGNGAGLLYYHDDFVTCKKESKNQIGVVISNGQY